MEQKNKLVIETITAFVSVDSDGNEGIMGYKMPDGTWLPLVCADPERIAGCFKLAEVISNSSGMPYRIVQFHQRTDVTLAIKAQQNKS